MEQSLRLKFRRGDWLAIALVVLIAALTLMAFLPGGSAGQDGLVQIYQDGRLIRELSLSEDARISVSGEYYNVIAVEDGRVAVVESDCPGGDCMHTKWISEPGRSIVCLPNRVELRITGESGVDFVVG